MDSLIFAGVGPGTGRVLAPGKKALDLIFVHGVKEIEPGVGFESSSTLAATHIRNPFYGGGISHRKRILRG